MLKKAFESGKSIGSKLGNFYTIGSLTVVPLLLMSFATATNPLMLVSGFFQNFLFDAAGQFSFAPGFNMMATGANNALLAGMQVGSGAASAYQAGNIGLLSDAFFSPFS